MFWNKFVKTIEISLFISILGAQIPPPVPSQYQDLYTQLSGQISSFNTTISAGWNGQPYPVLNAAQLRSAACEQGSQLFAPGYYNGVLNEMQSLQALGVNTMTVHVDFPTLDPAFYSNPADYQNYLNFYIQLSKDIHASGLKLLIENAVAFPQPGISTLDPSAFLGTLSWAQYEQGRAQQAAVIASQVHPDYLSVITEPETEANAASQPSANTAGGSVEMLNQILAAIQTTGVTGVSVGAGCGTWQANFQDFANGFAGTAVQFLDMHIYPINNSYLQNAITIAQIAQAAGKQVGMSEAWLYKIRDSELGVLSSSTVYGRDPFGFWAPLDQSFLQTLSNLGQYMKFTFVSAFWSSYFHVYLDYATYGSMSASQVLSTAGEQAGSAINTAQYTPTATAFEKMHVSPVDTIPPSAPTGLGFTATTSQINVTWLASTDNVGVAGYAVFRNGTLMENINGLYHQDFNLPANTSYTYVIKAFDALGNLSPGTTLIASTRSNPDTQAPSVPTGLTATAATSSQVNLSWTASTDNVGVLGYKIYRGASASTVSIYSNSSANSSADPNCSPTATYYYAVAAYDAAGNTSALSPVVAGRSLPDTVPPSVPTGLKAASVSSSNVTLSWNASTDNIAVSGYRIYRGSTAGNMQLMAVVPPTSYSDTRVSTKRSYYYAVAAQDSSTNVSAQTAPILITTP